MPHLKRGAMRDFLNILEEQGYFNPKLWNKSDFTYSFETGSKIEFFSLDMPHKVRGARRDRLFINEANAIPLETYEQLEVRTKSEIYLDWNPVSEFWWYTDILPHFDVDFITLTYRDNEGLSAEIVAAIESRRFNTAWWRVYGEGQLGEAEGRIFTGWNMIDVIPPEAKLMRYGLDFGYSNDPSAIVALYSWNNSIILDQIMYQKGLSNSEISAVLKNQPRAIIVADSAEPKSIDELIAYGLPVIASTKGAGSILQGIQYLQDRQVSMTKRSVDGWKEYRNYIWMTDKNGKIINEPTPFLNHFLDATRYANTSLTDLEPRERKQPSRPRLLYGNRLSR